MKITAPIETKVAASTTASLAVTALFALAATYHWFTPPPPQLTGLLITAIIGVAGWLAPHTHLRPLPAVLPPGTYSSTTPVTVSYTQTARLPAAAGPADPPATSTGTAAP